MDTMIDDLQIGITSPYKSELVDYLETQDFDTLTIVRSGLVSSDALTHLSRCDPDVAVDRSTIGPFLEIDNSPTAPENRWLTADGDEHGCSSIDGTTVESCRHTVTPELDALATALRREIIAFEDVDLESVVGHAEANLDDGLALEAWWDTRIVFPYRDEDGDVRYLIGRKTDDTDDKRHGNNVAKYLKQTVNRPWIDTDVVYEPLYGCHTVGETGSSGSIQPESKVDASGGRFEGVLLLTEGITDAILAHQTGVACIAPATTSFKQKHHPKLREYASRFEDIYVINDTESSGAGLDGALSTAATLREHDIDAKVGTLPLPADVEAIDLADFLHPGRNSADTDEWVAPASRLQAVLDDAMRPRTYPEFVPDKHEPTRPSTNRENEDHPNTSRDYSSVSGTSSNRSAIYHLSLGDVIDEDALGISFNHSGDSTLYRGDNPIEHVGDSHSGYFVIYETPTKTSGGDGDGETDESSAEKEYELRAYDHKKGVGYNALTWLACESGARSTESPRGGLSHEEVWCIWQYSKTASHIDIDSDDRIPLRAIWYLASEHDLAPEEEIPENFDTDIQLSTQAYTRVLELVEKEYGLTHGR